jgi:hypothetical protein
MCVFFGIVTSISYLAVRLLQSLLVLRAVAPGCSLMQDKGSQYIFRKLSPSRLGLMSCVRLMRFTYLSGYLVPSYRIDLRE